MHNTREVITQEIQKILSDKGVNIDAIDESTNLLADTEMDSLDLATLIVNLELIFEYDPFREGFKTFNTLGELTELYEGKNEIS